MEGFFRDFRGAVDFDVVGSPLIEVGGGGDEVVIEVTDGPDEGGAGGRAVAVVADGGLVEG